MQRIEKPQTTVITSREADKLLTQYNHFNGQRKQRPTIIAHYANKIREDMFHNATIMLATRDYGNYATVLLNGQHTLQAVIVANKPTYVTIERWTVNSPEEEAVLFSQFDSVGHRTQSDIVNALAKATGIKAPLYLCSGAVSAIVMKEKPNRKYTEYKARRLIDYQGYVAFLNHVFEETVAPGEKKLNKPLRRKAVYYAMLMTFEVNPEEAVGFWRRVRDGENLNRLMPEYHLRNFLTDKKTSWGMSMGGKQAVGTPEMASRCINAWNRYRRGDKVKMLRYYPDSPIPKAI